MRDRIIALCFGLLLITLSCSTALASQRDDLFSDIISSAQPSLPETPTQEDAGWDTEFWEEWSTEPLPPPRVESPAAEEDSAAEKLQQEQKQRDELFEDALHSAETAPEEKKEEPKQKPLPSAEPLPEEAIGIPAAGEQKGSDFPLSFRMVLIILLLIAAAFIAGFLFSHPQYGKEEDEKSEIG